MADASSDPHLQISPASESSTSRRRWLWLGVLLMLLLAGSGGYFAMQAYFQPKPSEAPLTAEVAVVIRHPGSRQTLLIEEADALPVRPGSSMTLQVDFNQPLYPYLLWLNTEGQVVPLYPWNNESNAVPDADQPPPRRRPTKVLISPGAGETWKFGKRGGLETILVLARRTPLETEVRLGSLLKGLPATPLRSPQELAVLGLDQRGELTRLLSRQRGSDDAMRAADQALLASLERLRELFDIIRIIRFAHEGE